MKQNLLCYNVKYFCFIALDFLVFLHNYCYTLLCYTSVTQHQVLLYYVLGYYLFLWCGQWKVHNFCLLFLMMHMLLLLYFLIFSFTSLYASLYLVTKTWTQNWNSSFSTTQFFVLNFACSLLALPSKFMIFWYSWWYV